MVFVDFDGTACAQDTGHAIARRFGGPEWDRLRELWIRRQISTRVRAEAEYASAIITWPEMEEVLSTCELDPRFREFCGFAEQAGVELAMVSDGFDAYINHILERAGPFGLKIYSNTVTFGSGTAELGFPMESEGCGHCGMCKAVPLRRARSEFDEITFIGNGYSDSCAVAHADIVYAKDSLAAYCTDRGIPFRPYRDFGDVIARARLDWGDASFSFESP